MLLGDTRRRSGGDLLYSFMKRPGTQMGKPLRQFTGSLIGADLRFFHFDDVAGVQLGSHVHNGDAGLLFPVQDRPIDGRRAAVSGQNGGMDVDGAAAGKFQNIVGQDLSVGRDDNELRRKLLYDGKSLPIPHFQGLINYQPLTEGIFLHRGKAHFMAPVFGLIGLGEHAAHLVPVLHQLPQGGHRKLRRAHKQDPHASGPFSPAPSSSSGRSSHSSSCWA